MQLYLKLGRSGWDTCPWHPASFYITETWLRSHVVMLNVCACDNAGNDANGLRKSGRKRRQATIPPGMQSTDILSSGSEESLSSGESDSEAESGSNVRAAAQPTHASDRDDGGSRSGGEGCSAIMQESMTTSCLQYRICISECRSSIRETIICQACMPSQSIQRMYVESCAWKPV